MALCANTFTEQVGRAAPVGAPASFEDVLVSGASLLGAASLGWVWLLVTITTVETSRGTATPRGALRRLVVVACGGALALGVAGPAVAASDPAHSPVAEASVLAGLPLPDRATAPHSLGPVAERPHEAGDTVRVAPGDSLWAIAERTLAGSASVQEIDERWRRIHRLNLATVGTDPDLLLPGQALSLPPGAAPAQEPTHREDRQ